MIVLLIVALVALVFVVGPALFVWSANELMEQASMPYQIDWNFWSWLAAVVLIVFLGSSAASRK